MSNKLDKSKHFGEVWGDSAGRAKFVQAGHYFDHDGNECSFGERDGDDRRGSNAGEGQGAGGAVAAAAPEVSAAMIVAARRGNFMAQALPILEGKAEDIVAELPDFDIDLLIVMAEIEALAKKRKTVLEGLQSAITAKLAEERQNAVAQGQTPAPAAVAVSPVDAQLSNQLSGG